jgi:hypothetical protein
MQQHKLWSSEQHSNSKKYSLINPDQFREDINNLPEILHFLYALHAAHMQKTIFERKWKKVNDFSNTRMVLFHIQTLTSLLQNFKHYNKIAWFPLQVIWDTITYLPYPASYIRNEDIISHRTIIKRDASEILMLFSATWANIMTYFLITGQWNIVALLAIHNKTTFRLAQALKSKNINSSHDQDQQPLPHDTEE